MKAKYSDNGTKNSEIRYSRRVASTSYRFLLLHQCFTERLLFSTKSILFMYTFLFHAPTRLVCSKRERKCDVIIIHNISISLLAWQAIDDDGGGTRSVYSDFRVHYIRKARYNSFDLNSTVNWNSFKDLDSSVT